MEDTSSAQRLWETVKERTMSALAGLVLLLAAGAVLLLLLMPVEDSTDA